MARSIPLEAGLITGGAVRAVATIRSATVTALHGKLQYQRSTILG